MDTETRCFRIRRVTLQRQKVSREFKLEAAILSMGFCLALPEFERLVMRLLIATSRIQRRMTLQFFSLSRDTLPTLRRPLALQPT